MDFVPFYEGQKVIAIENHPQGYFNKGDEFIIHSIFKSICKCKCWTVTIGMISKDGLSCECIFCNGIYFGPSKQLVFRASRFAPKQEEFQAITYTKILEKEPLSVN